MTTKLSPGDFTGLSGNYSKFRPAYSPDVLDAILNYVGKVPAQVDFADVGAGTGIWTRMLHDQQLHSVTAVEPNGDMRTQGEQDSQHTDITWLEGSGENTGLGTNSLDLVSMASSFHWVDFDKGMVEFHRILKKGGCFVALWNPRLIKINPLLVEIEDKLLTFAPQLKRVSSGNSGITETLTERFLANNQFSAPMYVEGFHTVQQTIEEYLGVWWSVNDIRSQAGEQNFTAFMDYVSQRIADEPYIETTYKTRAWIIRKL